MKNISHLVSTVSTNEDAYKLALEGAQHGFSVLADAQTGGKGRLGREWFSPAGSGLYCSIVLRPEIPFHEFPGLTLTAGLALCTVIEKLTGLDTFGLKWPNDLYCNGRKCGGILVESSGLTNSEEKAFVVVGIGLNVNNNSYDFPAELHEIVTSLQDQTAVRYSIQEIFFLLRDSLLNYVRIHEEQGFEVILKEWRKRDVLYGKEMEWLTTDKRVITGIGLGPDDTGKLLARDRDGRLHEILSGDVRPKKL